MDPPRFEEAFRRLMASARPASQLRMEALSREACSLFAQVRPLAEDHSLVERLKEAIAARGYAGDVRPALGTYVAITSRLLERPLNLAFVAQSASGKNAAIDAVLPHWRRVLKESIEQRNRRRGEYARWMLREVLLDPECRGTSAMMSAAGVTVRTAPIQGAGAGSTPSAALQSLPVKSIPIVVARRLMEFHHYLHSLPGGTRLSFGVFVGTRLLGAITLGVGPANGHSLVEGATPDDCLT